LWGGEACTWHLVVPHVCTSILCWVWTLSMHAQVSD
jgi:hypothetical protein